ncbi:MAG: GNAT family protein [Candidatus Thermoplasmatota archaeon]|nr:GNAT family protein [Candidatus Thermoplasmatota archaeon]
MANETIISGEKVILHPVEHSDIQHFVSWYQDEELRTLTGEVAPMTEKEAEEFFQKIQKDETRRWFMIVEKSTGRIIGECGLLRIFPAWRRTDVSVIIGEKDCWGKGYGMDAIRLLQRLAFEELKLHRMSIGVVGFNKRAIRFWKKAGFRTEGREREGYFYDGKFHDFVMMRLLEGEYEKRR